MRHSAYPPTLKFVVLNHIITCTVKLWWFCVVWNNQRSRYSMEFSHFYLQKHFTQSQIIFFEIHMYIYLQIIILAIMVVFSMQDSFQSWNVILDIDYQNFYMEIILQKKKIHWLIILKLHWHFLRLFAELRVEFVSSLRWIALPKTVPWEYDDD